MKPVRYSITPRLLRRRPARSATLAIAVAIPVVISLPATAVSYSVVYVPVTTMVNGKQVVVRRPVVRSVANITAPSITTQPKSVATSVGSAVTFAVVAVGSAPLTFQWRRNGVVISGATAASYTIASTTQPDNGAIYTVVLTNSAGSVTSTDAVLTINTTAAVSTLGGSCTPHSVTPAIATQAAWDAKFTARYGSALPDLDGKDETFAWHGHYWLRAYVSMTDTFGDSKYLDRAVTTIDHMLLNTDGTFGWNGDPIGGSQRLLDTGMIAHGIMYFVYLVWNDARFAAYRPKADQYLARLETVVRSYDFQWVDNPPVTESTGSYVYATCGAGSSLCSSKALLMYNQGATMVKAGLLIDRVKRLKGQTPDSAYLRRADAVAAMFPRFAKLEYGSYTWRYGGCRTDIAGPYGSLIEDTNHSHIDLSLLVWANRFRIGGIDAKVMNGLAGTLDKILTGAGTNNVARHVDGTGAPASDWDRLPIGYDWIDLAQTDPAVLDKVIRVYNQYLVDDTNSRSMLGWAEILRYTHCPRN